MLPFSVKFDIRSEEPRVNVELLEMASAIAEELDKDNLTQRI